MVEDFNMVEDDNLVTRSRDNQCRKKKKHRKKDKSINEDDLLYLF